MADDLPKTSSDGAVLLLAENALEKLKIADYDLEFSHRKGIEPFSRTYFAEPAPNAGNQWAMLISLVSWIMKQIGHDFAVDKYDDPNTSANKLMLALKQLNFEPDFPVSRLKQGYGLAVCQVLDFLASRLLKNRGFKFAEPVYPETDGFEEAEVDDADLGTTDVVDEAIESEDEDVLYTENLRSGSNRRMGVDGDGSADAHHGRDNANNGIMENEQSPEFMAAWRAELERVAPRLKRQPAASTNEWRSHLEQVRTHEKTIQAALPECAKQLKTINADLSDSLERISNKELFLSNSFERIAAEYKQVQEKLTSVNERFETSNAAVEKLSTELSAVTEALEDLKGDMDSRGNSMVDTSPLQKIRKALTKLKNEIKQMELRIGVVGHSLLVASLQTAQDARLAKAGTKGSVDGGVKSPGALSDGFENSPRSPVAFEMF